MCVNLLEMSQKPELVGVTKNAIGVMIPKTVLFSLLHNLFRFLLVNGYDTDKGQQKLVFTEKEVYRALTEFRVTYYVRVNY